MTNRKAFFQAKNENRPFVDHLDVEALGANVATHVTDACQVLVEQAAATGVEAALAKDRSADQKSALAKAEKVQGNTQRALDQALNLAAKRGEEVEAMREALREAQEGRRKVEVEAAQLRVSLRHMHHCMSMNALKQGLLGLEAAKASDIDDFV